MNVTNKYLKFWVCLLLVLLAITSCHDESDDILSQADISVLDLIKSGKKKPKMAYSTGEKKERATAEDDENKDEENKESLTISLEVEGADLHIHCEGFMKDGYLFIQDKTLGVIFTENVKQIDEKHPLDIYIPEAESYPYYLQLESAKYVARINIWLE